MTTVEAFAPAKINLTLHVTGQRADGYHLLDSLVMFADVGDRITLRPGEGLNLTVTGPMAQGVPCDARNLVLKAAHAMGVRDAHIGLEKHLPASAGIGGGSSDAAATLKALSRQTGRALPGDGGLSLGADVPVCLFAKAARMSGIGETVTPLDTLPALPGVLVNPGVALPTPAIFSALTDKSNAPMPDPPPFASPEDAAKWLATQRNDLQAPATTLAPVISDVLAALHPSLMARMSGSGATCVGLCASAKDAAALAARIKAVQPGWWVVATTLS